MGPEDVDFLKACCRGQKTLSRRIRLNPPRVRIRGTWTPFLSFQVETGAIRFELRGGGAWRLPIVETHSAAEEELRNVARTFSRRLGLRLLRFLTGTDRNRGQTAAFPRALLRKRDQTRGIILAPRGSAPSSQARFLTSAVLWWDQSFALRRDECEVWMVVPEDWAESVTPVLELLTFPHRLFFAAADGTPQVRVLEGSPSSLRSAFELTSFDEHPPEDLLRSQLAFPWLDLVYRKGRWELSYLGFPILWCDGSRCHYDWFEPKPLVGNRELQLHLERVRRIRCAHSPRPDHHVFRYRPERWLESLILRTPGTIDPDLTGELYVQVPTYIGGGRRVLDLLGCTRRQRCVIVELKIESEASLLLQSVEYWCRVGMHIRRGELKKAGYFRDQCAGKAPLVYLVSPLFNFHPALTRVRRYLPSDLEIRCVGINLDWKTRLEVVRRFRL